MKTMKKFIILIIIIISSSGCFLKRNLVYEGDDIIIGTSEPNRFALGHYIGQDPIDKHSCWVYTDTTAICIYSDVVTYSLNERLYWYEHREDAWGGTHYKTYLISRDSRYWYRIKCFEK